MFCEYLNKEAIMLCSSIYYECQQKLDDFLNGIHCNRVTQS